MSARKTALFTLAVVGVLLFGDSRAAEAAGVGVRGGYYAEAGAPFLGAELVFRISERVQIAPSFEVVDVERGRYVNASLDALYDLSCACNSASAVWAGAGLALVSREDVPADTVEPGLDLLLGIGYRAGRVLPHALVKVILKDGPEVVVGVGIRF